MNDNDLISIISEQVIRELRNSPDRVDERFQTRMEFAGTAGPAGARHTPISVGVSARHVHLCRKALDILFGKGYELTVKNMLMGGQYSCNETVTIVGANLRAVENVRILGPLRDFSQVEVAQTDAVRLGLRPPIRESGNIKGSAPVSIIGPKGAVYLNEGCILAMRHIHMSCDDAARFGVRDGDKVSVEFKNIRAGVFHDVLIRVNKSFTLEIHIDTDEGNALGIKTGDLGVIL